MEFINKNPKIFVISGKARSGKNTVCQIIEKHYKNKKTINLAYADYLKMYAQKISSWDGNESDKPRELLQQLGVELIKTHIDELLLVKRMIEDIKIYSYFFDIITISDARFPDEIDKIKNNFSNVISIRVLNNQESNLNDKEKNHKTETAMNNYTNYDYIINNNGIYNDLEKEVIKCI